MQGQTPLTPNPAMPAMQNPQQALLAKLQDLREPEAIGAFPLAPGWYLAAALLIAAIGLAVWGSVKLYGRGRYRRRALAELKHIETNTELSTKAKTLALMRLLKRAYFSAYPNSRTRIAGVYGREWLQLLDTSSTKPLATAKIAEFIDAALYAPDHAISESQLELLIGNARRWLRYHRRPETDKRRKRDQRHEVIHV